ncbi:MAG: clostripain-related cysteine peptidase [Elusimicrobia bacterium]|nr:clostripain-related cysteine peptidase [Elusimicrobiota bacterium]
MNFLLLLPALCLPLSVYSSDFSLNSAFVADLPAAADSPVPKAPAPLAEWTVMYFVNGKNNLESSAMMDMNQLELVGTTARVRIVAELGRMNGQPEGDDHSEGDWTGVRRYLIVKDADTGRITSPVLMQRARYDMGDWKELAGFIQWTKANYPARRYALVLWDHGNGWKPVDPANAPHFNDKGFSLDEETGSEISTPQIALALKAVGGVNFLMLDGCNMAMASVAYEVKDYAEALTASEESEPGVVVRYAQFLGMLNARPAMSADEFAANTVRTYRDYFLNSSGDSEGTQLTQSAVRLAGMVPFRVKLDAWAAAAVHAEPQALSAAKKNARLYGEDPEFKDLYDFVELVTAGTAQPGLKARGREVMRFMKDELVIENWAQDAASHGLSIYVPDAYDPLYDGLAWAKDGSWDEFARFIATIK